VVNTKSMTDDHKICRFFSNYVIGRYAIFTDIEGMRIFLTLLKNEDHR